MLLSCPSAAQAPLSVPGWLATRLKASVALTSIPKPEKWWILKTLSPNIFSGSDGICNSSAHFSGSADLSDVGAGSCQPPGPQGEVLLWKPWAILAQGGPMWAEGTTAVHTIPQPHPTPHLTLSAHLLLCAPVPTFLREFRPYWSVLPRGGGGWSGMPAQLLAIRKAGERDPLPIHEYKHWFLAHSKTPINYNR